jgi:hypothetical protein
MQQLQWWMSAQLTGLKHLRLCGLQQLADPALLPLTALTALEQLALWDENYQNKSLRNKVSLMWKWMADSAHDLRHTMLADQQEAHWHTS